MKNQKLKFIVMIFFVGFSAMVQSINLKDVGKWASKNKAALIGAGLGVAAAGAGTYGAYKYSQSKKEAPAIVPVSVKASSALSIERKIEVPSVSPGNVSVVPPAPSIPVAPSAPELPKLKTDKYGASAVKKSLVGPPGGAPLVLSIPVAPPAPEVPKVSPIVSPASRVEPQKTSKSIQSVISSSISAQDLQSAKTALKKTAVDEHDVLMRELLDPENIKRQLKYVDRKQLEKNKPKSIEDIHQEMAQRNRENREQFKEKDKPALKEKPEVASLSQDEQDALMKELLDPESIKRQLKYVDRKQLEKNKPKSIEDIHQEMKQRNEKSREKAQGKSLASKYKAE